MYQTQQRGLQAQGQELTMAQQHKNSWLQKIELLRASGRELDPKKQVFIDRILGMYDMLPPEDLGNLSRLNNALAKATGMNLESPSPMPSSPEDMTPDQMRDATGGPSRLEQLFSNVPTGEAPVK